MSLDCKIYSTNKNKDGRKNINILLNDSLGWIVLKYLHDKKYVHKDLINSKDYTTQLNRTVILQMINELTNYFNHQDMKAYESSYYRSYPSTRASDLGYVLGILYELLIYMSSNIDDKITLHASW